MTARQVVNFAKMVEVEEFILLHLSVRDSAVEWLVMLDEAKAEFPATRFPKHWDWVADLDS